MIQQYKKYIDNKNVCTGRIGGETMNYECYEKSDESARKWIVQQVFAENQYLKRQVDYLMKENQALQPRPPDPLDKPNHQAHATQAARVWAESQKLHILSGKMS